MAVLTPRRPRGTRATTLAIGAAGAGLLLLVVSGPGYRLGLLPLAGGLLAYVASVAAFFIAFLAGGSGLLRSRGTGGARPRSLAWTAFLLGVLVPLHAAWILAQGAGLPPIHDLTTDPDDPPLFVALLSERADAPNPPEYAGAEVARAQREGWPGLAPLHLPHPPGEVFGTALEVVDRMGWELVDTAPAEGRIEATDRTFWFGFADDVVIRIREEPGRGSRVDVRSKSRVGQGDLGANARRIERFLRYLGAGDGL